MHGRFPGHRFVDAPSVNSPLIWRDYPRLSLEHSGLDMDMVLDTWSAAPARRTTRERFETVQPGHALRGSLERFIADVYACQYGAQVRHFTQTLVGVRSRDSQWAAAVGYTLAGPAALFLEQYLDQPAEAAVAKCIGTAVCREQLVEVGNLAATTAGAARQIIVGMTALLHRLGRSWVVLTSTKALLNSFARLDIHPIPIAAADPKRLPDGGASWGTYYAGGPRVMTASIALEHARLAARNQFVRTL